MRETRTAASPVQGHLGRVSVVIANHNHGRFLGEAITSALDLEWDDVEVIVVDDGSTDDSRAVMASFGDRITAVLQTNRGQREAANRGYAASTGEVVIFLDADDALPPELARRTSQVWTAAVSKVQFRAQPVDVNGKPVAQPYPRYDPTPTSDQIRHWARTTSAYPTPPGSANAYAKWYLERIFPLDASIGFAADSGCLAGAPHVGDVVVLPDVHVAYRWHSGQLSDLVSTPERFAREVTKARGRWRLAQRLAEHHRPIDERPLFRSRELLQFRVAAHRLASTEERRRPPLPGDGALVLWRDVLRAPVHPGPERLHHRLGISIWCAATLLAPMPLVPHLLRWRYQRRA